MDHRLTRITTSASTMPEWTPPARSRPLGKAVHPVPAEGPSASRLAAEAAAPSVLRLVKPTADSGLPVPPAAETPIDRPSSEEAHAAMERLLASRDFDATPRSRDFLRFVFEETMAGRPDGLTQAAVATRVFGRRHDFDPTIDPIVRIQAGRLRRSLERYYLLTGAADRVRIDLPRGGYAPVVRWTARHEQRSAVEPARSGSDGWPCVVVGPFGGGAESPRTAEMALRLCECLAVEIGRLGDVRVVLRSELESLGPSRREGGDYALSVQLSLTGGGWRAFARLVDCRNARQVWAEELRGAAVQLALAQEEAARAIAGRVASEHGVISRTLSAERRRTPTPAPTAYEAVLRSYRFLRSRGEEDLVTALQALERVVRAEPECSLAWVQLARLYAEAHGFDLTAAQAPLDFAVDCGFNGVQLEPSSQRARGALAHALFAKDDLAAARTEARKAVDLESTAGAPLDWIGGLLTLLGDERGPVLVREAASRAPYPTPIASVALWADHLRHRRLAESYEAAQRCHEPGSFWPGLMRTCSLAYLGKRTEAKAGMAELVRHKPELRSRGRALIGRLIKLPAALDGVVEGMAKAGLPLS
jgi:adenylate cyclase